MIRIFLEATKQLIKIHVKTLCVEGAVRKRDPSAVRGTGVIS